MIEPEKIFHDLKVAPTGQDGSVLWQVSPHLPYLDGHFPGTPILPAIATVDASMHVLRQVLDRKGLKLVAVVNAKFLSPITPQEVLRIEWTIKSELDFLVEWKEESSGRSLASLLLRCDVVEGK